MYLHESSPYPSKNKIICNYYIAYIIIYNYIKNVNILFIIVNCKILKTYLITGNIITYTYFPNNFIIMLTHISNIILVKMLDSQCTYDYQKYSHNQIVRNNDFCDKSILRVQNEFSMK